MNTIKYPFYACRILGNTVILKLEYLPHPDRSQPDTLARFECQNACVECGVKQTANPSEGMFNWEKCPAYNEYHA